MVIPAVDLHAVAIRHVPFEDLGLVGLILKQAGWSISYRDAPTVDLDDPLIGNADLLIVLGGPDWGLRRGGLSVPCPRD